MIRTLALIDVEGAKYGYFMKRNKGTYLLGCCNNYDLALREEATINQTIRI